MTTYNQFGFKDQHSTDLRIFVLKERIRYYISHGSNMYVCFLDATSAFDSSLKHSKIFQKLIDQKIPLYIVRSLIIWYQNQELCMRWNNQLSNAFHVTNDMQQGGIISPPLFNVYMDTLSLNGMRIGCCINNCVINHLIYADDLVLFPPSAKGLQKLVETVHNYGVDNNIKFNQTRQSVCVLSKLYLKSRPFFLVMTNYVDKYKHLGHVVQYNLSDNGVIYCQVRSIYGRAKKFNFCSDSVKIQLFKSYSANMYCCQLWCKYTVANYIKLKVA